MSNNKVTFRLRLWSVVLLLIVASPVTILGQDCPPCYKDQQRLVDRHGPGTSGRQLAKVYIDNSSFTPTELGAINPAVSSAISGWNSAFNNRVTPTQRSQYEFQATTDPSLADFVVKKGTPLFNCIGIDMSVYPHVINVGSNWFTASEAEREGGMKHEIGHRMGIGHPADDTSINCEPFATIMRGAGSNCRGGDTQIGFNDIARHNQALSSPGNCTVNAPTTTYYSPPGGGDGDPCGGDMCCGDPCCGDPGCGEECNLVCDTWCYTSCTVYDDYGECYWWEEVCETNCEWQCF